MNKQYITYQEKERLKREFVHKYLLLMIIIFLIYMLIYTFIQYNNFLAYYIAGGLVLTSTAYLIARKSNSLDKFVRCYFILSPIYIIFIMVYFWNVSVMSFVWLLPLPLGVYIFFPTKKDIIAFTLYGLFIIIAEYIIVYFFSFSLTISRQSIVLTDTLLIVSNILIILLEIYYTDKIRKAEFFLQFEKKYLVRTKNSESESYHQLFEKIEEVVKEKMLFKDDKFNISKLCIELDVNSKYIAKALRANNYSNFNTFLNFHRINHVKKLLEESNLQRITLMYIYTEAGFSNQSTFNRVFKQFENMTPSEYIAMKHG